MLFVVAQLMLQHVFKGAKTSLIRNGLPMVYIARSRSGQRRQQPAFHRATEQIGSLDDYRNAYKYEAKIEKTREDYMAELVARLDAPAPKENTDANEKIIQKLERSLKSPKKKKMSIKQAIKEPENTAENIQLPQQVITHSSKDRFPELTQEVIRRFRGLRIIAYDFLCKCTLRSISIK